MTTEGNEATAVKSITCTGSLFIYRYLKCDQSCVLFIQGTYTVKKKTTTNI